jgi:hypothetical protein
MHGHGDDRGQRLIHFVRDRGGKLGQACGLGRPRELVGGAPQRLFGEHLVVYVEANAVPLHDRVVAIAHRSCAS